MTTVELKKLVRSKIPTRDVRIQLGRVVVLQSYFYPMGTTAEKFAAKIQSETGLVCFGEDQWAAWPKTSYFAAIVSEIPAPAPTTPV